MASYTAKQLNRAKTPIEGLTAGENYVFSITNNTSTGTAYFTVETDGNDNKVYTAPTTLVSDADLAITTGFTCSVATSIIFYSESLNSSLNGINATLKLTTTGVSPNCILTRCEIAVDGTDPINFNSGGTGYVLGETITISQNDLQAAAFSNADSDAVFTVGATNLIPTNALGLYSGFSEINENSLVTSSYVSSVVVPKGVGSYTFTPTANIAVSSSFLRATGGMTLNLSPSIYSFTTKAELQTAVNLWISDNTAALATYGGINTWNTTAITNMGDLFSNKTTFNSDISNWDVSNVTNMSNMFTFAESFNQPLNNWDVRNVTIMGYMFQYADAFQQPLNLWQLNSLTGTLGVGFMGNTGAAGAITYNLLDTLYNGWVIDLAALQSNVTISFGNSTFTAAGLTAKNILINDKGWTITDGGQV
tara:strand:+ start:103 stop:1365 length:1263 start_codon:yes stop_codon:yes gene_type:complete